MNEPRRERARRFVNDESQSNRCSIYSKNVVTPGLYGADCTAERAPTVSAFARRDLQRYAHLGCKGGWWIRWSCGIEVGVMPMA